MSISIVGLLPPTCQIRRGLISYQVSHEYFEAFRDGVVYYNKEEEATEGDPFDSSEIGHGERGEPRRNAIGEAKKDRKPKKTSQNRVFIELFKAHSAGPANREGDGRSESENEFGK